MSLLGTAVLHHVGAIKFQRAITNRSVEFKFRCAQILTWSLIDCTWFYFLTLGVGKIVGHQNCRNVNFTRNLKNYRNSMSPLMFWADVFIFWIFPLVSKDHVVSIKVSWQLVLFFLAHWSFLVAHGVFVAACSVCSTVEKWRKRVRSIFLILTRSERTSLFLEFPKVSDVLFSSFSLFSFFVAWAISCFFFALNMWQGIGVLQQVKMVTSSNMCDKVTYT